MVLLEAVRQALWDEYNAGASQEEIAGKYALKQSPLSNFMNGKRKLSLEKIQSMYPTGRSSKMKKTIKFKKNA